MEVRIALLLGSSLISGHDGSACVLYGEIAYGPDDLLPAMSATSLPGEITAREFVRHSMIATCGEDEKAWPALARKFLQR